MKILLLTWDEYNPVDLIKTGREMKADLDRRYKFKSRAQVPRKTGNRPTGSHKNRCPRCGRFVPKGTVVCCSFDYTAKGGSRRADGTRWNM